MKFRLYIFLLNHIEIVFIDIEFQQFSIQLSVFNTFFIVYINLFSYRMGMGRIFM